MVRTTDIDFLIPKLPPKTVSVDIPALMEELGFHNDYSSDGWLTLHKPELHVEFLWPRMGPKDDKPIEIKDWGINARPLRHMWLLRDHQIAVLYKGMTLTVPHPVAYSFHKLIIADRRTKPEKQAKDRAQAEEVLLAFRETGDRKMIHEFFDKLSKKDKSSVEMTLAKMPLLDGLL